jgi:NAD(P)-dependent dehydrogenase (short-subunit alcohol dehydrogenase family)
MIARHLSSVGARVAVVARTQGEVEGTVDLIEGAGGVAVAFALDVSDHAAVTGMVAETERRLGPIDLLVNDAAIVAPFGPSWEVEAEQWWRLLEVNLYGSFLCAHAVLPGMTKRRRGRIVNLASDVGLTPVPYGSAYVTSKAAVIRLSEALAMETEEYGVTIFAIDPGWVSTAMTEYVIHSDEGQRWMPWAQSVEGSDDHVGPEQAAELVATLASGRADRLTGRYLRVSDDLDDLIHRAQHVRDHDLHSMRLRDERDRPNESPSAIFNNSTRFTEQGLPTSAPRLQ